VEADAGPDEWARRAEEALIRGDRSTAIAWLRRAVPLYAANGPEASADGLAAWAAACKLLADLLAADGRAPEAMQAYQEAADVYARVPGAEALADECAKRIVSGVKKIWRMPEQRLYLLIARHEREVRQLAASPDTEAAQGDRTFHIATILQRAGRFADAAGWLSRAVALYAAAPGTALKQAVCHHRLAGLHHHELGRPELARQHYREAIHLYAALETPSEGEQMNRALCEWLLADLERNEAEHQ
jgi:tetratricopeptide (TPR) repeat protein